MAERQSVVFLMSPKPRREELWTSQAAALAEELNMDVRLADDPAAPGVLSGAEAAITSWGSPRLDAGYLDAAAAERLQIVGHAAGSVQPIVSPALFERGIALVSANAEMARCVAQWAHMMTMIAARRLEKYANFGTHHAMKWKPDQGPGSLHRMTIGIWGYGAVAREFIRLMRAFEVGQILVASDYLTDAEAAEQQLKRVDLPDLFSQSSIVHLMESLTHERVGRIDAELLGRMADGSTLINPGRADLVDESALMGELTSGRLNACLDVYHQEPLPDDHPLRALSNVVLTPHTAGEGSRDRYVPLVLGEFDRHFRRQALQYEITPEHAAAMTQPSAQSR